MTRRTCLVAALVSGLSAAPAVAQTAGGDREAVMQVQRQIEDASAKRDTAGYARLTTADFVRVSNGRFIAKAEWIRDSVGTGAPRKPALNEDPQLRLLGPVAVLVVKNTPQGPGPNGQAPSAGRMSRVFVKTDGTWRAALTTTSPLAQAAPASSSAGRPAPAAQASWTPQQTEVLNTLRAISAAVSGAKPDAFSAVTANDFIAVGSDGNVVTKADRMKAIGASKPSADTFTVPTFIHVYGDAATAGWTNSGGGITVKALVKQNGRWVQLLNHNAPGTSAATR